MTFVETVLVFASNTHDETLELPRYLIYGYIFSGRSVAYFVSPCMCFVGSGL
jgi:hypothetical protein